MCHVLCSSNTASANRATTFATEKMSTKSQQNDVRVSVLIPVFNRRDLVVQAIDSALAQDVDGMELVVIDNCSDDGTWELLQSLHHEKLRCLRNNKNLGLFGNFNRCGDEAKGEYTIFLCSDDRLAPSFLRSAIEQLGKQPRAVLLSSRGVAIDRFGKQVGKIASRFPPGTYSGRSVPAAWFWANYFYGGNPLNYPSGVVFRTSALRASLPFRGEVGAPADIDLYFRVLSHGDLLVSDTIGCHVLHHEEQAADKIRRSGELTRQDLRLLEAFRPNLESVGAYEQVRRQAAYHVLRTLMRVGRHDLRGAAQLFREFAFSPWQMIVAGVRLKFLRALESLFGPRPTPHLEALGARQTGDIEHTG